ncbi:hypothetical protein MITS9509_02378 [Synechococcus sp. MIT S9509]|uniref:hypothetical protein n=1 Tax=Synechococcus sp. MIT S9509 TaxID=1801630 RepID=UPI0007BB840B|nr:hypothetical protein [Synechococcus sp. MIT S9509]KZR91442.1 hypothetical protein MITS9509_02378 [Synechococcus sp. MIT S9509]
MYLKTFSKSVLLVLLTVGLIGCFGRNQKNIKKIPMMMDSNKVLALVDCSNGEVQMVDDSEISKHGAKWMSQLELEKSVMKDAKKHGMQEVVPLAMDMWESQIDIVCSKQRSS